MSSDLYFNKFPRVFQCIPKFGNYFTKEKPKYSYQKRGEWILEGTTDFILEKQPK